MHSWTDPTYNNIGGLNAKDIILYILIILYLYIYQNIL
jgi:hypothetical protein